MTEVVHGLDADGRNRVAALLAQGRFFWLDASLSDTSRDQLVDALRLPGAAAAAIANGSSRFHADEAFLVFGVRCFVERQAIEVKVVITGDYLLTAHAERISLPDVLAVELPGDRGRRYIVYSVLDAMLASAFDELEAVGVELDALAATWTAGGDGRVSRARLGATAARLATMRRWMTVEEAVLERLAVEIGTLPGFGTDAEPSFDRLDQQAARLLAAVDAAANGMGTLLSLQLNERAYLVSILATIFVPLSFITGFFGMNFGWMVSRIDTALAFGLLGLAIPAAAAVVSWRLLARWLPAGRDATPRSPHDQ